MFLGRSRLDTRREPAQHKSCDSFQRVNRFHGSVHDILHIRLRLPDLDGMLAERLVTMERVEVLVDRHNGD